MKTGLLVVSLELLACQGMSVDTNLVPFATSTTKSWPAEEYSQEQIIRYDAIALGLVDAK